MWFSYLYRIQNNSEAELVDTLSTTKLYFKFSQIEYFQKLLLLICFTCWYKYQLALHELILLTQFPVVRELLVVIWRYLAFICQQALKSFQWNVELSLKAQNIFLAFVDDSPN